MMKLSKRRLGLFGAIAIVVLILITLVAAPTNNKINRGSTYSRAPDGYGAWYAFMSERGTPIQRWQKPFSELINTNPTKQPITLLRVNSNLIDKNWYTDEKDWVKRGNTLVIVGVRQPVTDAPFSTLQNSPQGKVKIETRRRYKNPENPILNDQFGAIIWQETIENGQIILITTPHLAANAYQDFQANYELLAQIITQPQKNNLKNWQQTNNTSVTSVTPSAATSAAKMQNQLWVDEYIHGYKDTEVIKRETGENLFSYLAKKPLFPAFLQGLILLLITIWVASRRFGKPLTLTAPVIDNSEAYIQALGGVLQKAGRTEFILDVVGKEEQLKLQKALGLGEIPLDYNVLINAWIQQTGRPATELKQLLQQPTEKRRISDTNLLNWLEKWKEIRHYLPF